MKINNNNNNIKYIQIKCIKYFQMRIKNLQISQLVWEI